MAHFEYWGDGFFVALDPGDDSERAGRILRAAVLRINDRVVELYAGAEPPERVSELEVWNYG